MHRKNSYKRILNSTFVGTAIFMTVLTIMLAGCRENKEKPVSFVTNNTSAASDKLADDNYDNDKEDSAYDTRGNVDNDFLEDGEYEVFVTLTGGSGKTTIESPAKVLVQEGKAVATIIWSSENYDYMIVNGEKIFPINSSGNSTFEIEVDSLNSSLNVVADTVAMSKPHEIEYSITFSTDNPADSQDEELELQKENEESSEASDWKNKHTLTGKLERKYAEKFEVSYYDNKYTLLTINGAENYILVNDDDEIPSDLPKDFTVINTPIESVYMVSSASYDYISKLDCLEQMKFTSFKIENVTDEKLKELMESGEVMYAGKYSAPDYELLISKGCKLAIENTMILHSIEVVEQLNKLHIKTLIDYSSYESSPLGRMEWIKLYGLLTGKEETADNIFNEKEKQLSTIGNSTGKTVAYFYISNGESVVVRKNQDYISNLIEISGGKYIFDGMSEYNGTGTKNIQKEAFYDAVCNCDYLIYNTTISGPLKDMNDLLTKCSILQNTKAYKQGNIYCTKQSIYEKPMEIADVSEDISNMLNGVETKGYIYKLK